MQQYDAALKSLLQRLAPEMIEQVTGLRITRWHNVELPLIRFSRVDLLGETADGRLVHIELQSTNDPYMALRMAEYALAILRQFGRMPIQLILYVGLAPAKMETLIQGPHLTFECRVMDIRELDGDRWLASDRIEDNVIAILMRFSDQIQAIRRILARIAEGEPAKRSAAMTELMLLAGLRKMGDIIKHEVQQMPILNDIMDHEVFGPLILQGRTEGRTEAEKELTLRLLAQRFGPLPGWARNRVESMPASQISLIALRVLDAANLEDLLR